MRVPEQFVCLKLGLLPFAFTWFAFVFSWRFTCDFYFRPAQCRIHASVLRARGRVRAFLLLQGLVRPEWSNPLKKHRLRRRRALSNPQPPSDPSWWRRRLIPGRAAAVVARPPPESSLFLTRLPPEIRLMIYRLVLPRRDPYTVMSPGSSSNRWSRYFEMDCDFSVGRSEQGLLTLPLTCKAM